MKSKRSVFYLILTGLLVLSLACLLGGGETEPDQRSVDSVATSVAATLAALDVQEEQVQPTPKMTVEDSGPEINFNYAGVSLYFTNALGENISAGVEPAVIEENTWWSTPEHRSFTINNWVINDAFLDARIRIYPLQDYKDINPGVGDRLDSLAAVLENKPPDGGDVSVIDIHNAAQMYKSNVKYLSFQNGEGIRYLTQYGQALYPLGRPNMFYTFQGLTDDGVFFISAWLPATHPSLPHGDSVTMDQAFMDNWENYIAQTEAQLNAEADNTFLPPLRLLDTMMESLLVLDP